MPKKLSVFPLLLARKNRVSLLLILINLELNFVGAGKNHISIDKEKKRSCVCVCVCVGLGFRGNFSLCDGIGVAFLPPANMLSSHVEWNETNTLLD